RNLECPLSFLSLFSLFLPFYSSFPLFLGRCRRRMGPSGDANGSRLGCGGQSFTFRAANPRPDGANSGAYFSRLHRQDSVGGTERQRPFGGKAAQNLARLLSPLL